MTYRRIPAPGRIVWPVLTILYGLLAAGWAQAQADRIVGRPDVADGDTLVFAQAEVDLIGIDAPELTQTCGGAGAPWNCGLEARWALINRIGRNWVTCVPRSQRAAGAPRARCYLAGVGQLDIAEWLVAEGWALVEGEGGERYLSQEAAAQTARKGLWRGAFVAPWDWRRAHSRPTQ